MFSIKQLNEDFMRNAGSNAKLFFLQYFEYMSMDVIGLWIYQWLDVMKFD